MADSARIVPAVGFEDGLVHRGVQLAEFEDVGRAFVGVVEAVVGLGQALVVSDHQIGAEVVVGFAGGFDRGVRLEVLREGKGLETTPNIVSGVVFKRRPLQERPRFVSPRAEGSNRRESIESKYDNGLA